MTAPKILLVEDDVNLGFVIKDNLEMNGGFQVRLCEDGEEGWQAFLQEAFDVCVLDVMLPKKDGFSLAESIRSKNEFVPIIFLTAKGMKEDKITGFKVGADDYMTKPFSIEELILRIQVCLKHTKRQTNSTTQSDNAYYLGTYNFDYQNLTLNHTNEVVT
ncbi:MAG: response regulator transcription factor, partial [Thermoflexibacteraceae bacterium]